jgi:predicted nucleic acid-binding protein
VIVVSDSTIFIGLAKLGKIDLLQNIFTKVFIPEEIFKELVKKGKSKPGAKLIQKAPWIEVKPVSDHTEVNLLTASLERGEAEVLVLAKEIHADLVLLDEEKARKSAILAGFNVMGLLGVLVVAKQSGLIPNIREPIKILQKNKFRISDRTIMKALKKAGE